MHPENDLVGVKIKENILVSEIAPTNPLVRHMRAPINKWGVFGIFSQKETHKSKRTDPAISAGVTTAHPSLSKFKAPSSTNQRPTG